MEQPDKNQLAPQIEENEEGSLWGEEEESGYISTDRKVGIARFFELLGRDFGTFYTASFIFLVACLPGMAILYFSVMAEIFPGAILGGLLLGLAGAPALCALVDTLLRSMRDEMGLWWSKYKKAWKQNWRQSLLPGAVFGIFAGIWGWGIMHLPNMENVPAPVWVCMLLGMVFAMILILYTAAQIVLINLSTAGILKNSGLFIGGYFPKSLAAGVVSGVYWALCFLYMPYSVVFLMITGAWFPVLISLMLIYPILNRVLHIEEELELKNAEKYKETL